MKIQTQMQVHGTFKQVLVFHPKFNHSPKEVQEMFKRGELLTTMQFGEDDAPGTILCFSNGVLTEVGYVQSQESVGDENEYNIVDVQLLP